MSDLMKKAEEYAAALSHPISAVKLEIARDAYLTGAREALGMASGLAREWADQQDRTGNNELPGTVLDAFSTRLFSLLPPTNGVNET